mmetsp:Transcript_25855/g.74740  ORF Transcript_25855/g.74740 Transcript_25855/m.74740 type:complete len:103 (-) Transcript_25855:206-514(-)|eukprot:CAMPEP_0168400942 /NCGR_PEP_ID=MMETSP0228-20121227/22855_1 /TAXON_ID=133427 /ORGANISM="Protoceratium reticulatum, Strain CCCM 535 (=CCMP 1889)" /LENGTH=102 /DNA_ID=CAMNT_0008414493 /DNA_START=90 /DNA_END=398 /DNA_ORIENTATION=+
MSKDIKANTEEWATEWGDQALEKCKHWLVLEPLIWIVPKPDPKQTAKDKLGVKGQGEIVQGDGIKVDGLMWLKLSYDGKEGYILIDGKAVGAKRKFLEPVPG